MKFIFYYFNFENGNYLSNSLISSNLTTHIILGFRALFILTLSFKYININFYNFTLTTICIQF